MINLYNIDHFQELVFVSLVAFNHFTKYLIGKFYGFVMDIQYYQNLFFSYLRWK